MHAFINYLKHWLGDVWEIEALLLNTWILTTLVFELIQMCVARTASCVLIGSCDGLSHVSFPLYICPVSILKMPLPTWAMCSMVTCLPHNHRSRWVASVIFQGIKKQQFAIFGWQCCIEQCACPLWTSIAFCQKEVLFTLSKFSQNWILQRLRNSVWDLSVHIKGVLMKCDKYSVQSYLENNRK